jgi:predicted nucleotidyltransferase
MSEKQQIISNIKAGVQNVLPDAEVILFGSRAAGTADAESDWDILVIAEEIPDKRNTRITLHNKLFPLSVSIGSFINLLLVTRDEWLQNPSYFSLRHSVTLNHQLL